MKKLLLALLLFPSLAYAQSYDAFKPLGGVDKTTVIPDVTATSTNETIDEIATKAFGAAQQTDIDKTIHTSSSIGPSIFLGGISWTSNMGDAAAMRDILATKKIGLYLMPNGVQGFWGKSTYQSAESNFLPVGKEFGEFGWHPVNSYTAVTLSNTTSSNIALSNLSTSFTDSSGNTWLYTATGTSVRDISGATACQSFSNGTWTFQVPANGSCTINITVDVNGAVELPSTSTLTPSISGLTVSSFLPVTAANSGSTGYGTIGITQTGADAATQVFASGTMEWATETGQNVVLGAVNIDDEISWTPTMVTQWKAYVDGLRSHGVKTVVPYLRAGNNSAIPNYAYPLMYTMDGAWQFTNDRVRDGIKDAIIYGGGLAIDWPPVSSSAYGEFVNMANMSMCKWALEQHLECVVTVHPPAVGNTTYLQYLNVVSSLLKSWGALPTRWVVENYELDTSTSPWSQPCTAVGTANDTTKADVTNSCSGGGTKTYTYAESLNAAALALANEDGTSTPYGDAATLTSTGGTYTYADVGLGQRGTQVPQLSLSDLADGGNVMRASSAGVGPGYAVPRLDPVGRVIGWGYTAVGWGYNTLTSGFGYCLSSNWCIKDNSSNGLNILDNNSNNIVTVDGTMFDTHGDAIRTASNLSGTYTTTQALILAQNGGAGNFINYRGAGAGGYYFSNCSPAQTVTACTANYLAYIGPGGSVSVSNNFILNSGKKYCLDSSCTNYVTESTDSSKIYISNSTAGNLMSIDASTGNILSKGTITQSTTP